MEKTNFLLVFHEENYISDLRNVTMVGTLIYDSHTFLVFFSSFLCLGKSLRKDFLCKVTLSDF